MSPYFAKKTADFSSMSPYFCMVTKIEATAEKGAGGPGGSELAESWRGMCSTTVQKGWAGKGRQVVIKG